MNNKFVVETRKKQRRQYEIRSNALRDKISALNTAEKRATEQTKIANATALLDILDDKTIAQRIQLDIEIVKALRKEVESIN